MSFSYNTTVIFSCDFKLPLYVMPPKPKTTMEKRLCLLLCYPMYLGSIKPMKGKALRKHSLHEKTAASVLLKPFISDNE